MNKPVRFFLGLLVAASLAFVSSGIPAAEKDKAKDAKPVPAEKGKPEIKVLFNNDKVRVLEVTFKPGDEAPNVARPLRVVRALKGGTLTRIYPDGKKEEIAFETGEVKIFEASPAYIYKNEGKSDLVHFITFVKEPKK